MNSFTEEKAGLELQPLALVQALFGNTTAGSRAVTQEYDLQGMNSVLCWDWWKPVFPISIPLKKTRRAQGVSDLQPHCWQRTGAPQKIRFFHSEKNRRLRLMAQVLIATPSKQATPVQFWILH